METQYKQTETEYSKKWAAENPALFTASMLSFMDKHTGDCWALTMKQTAGFFKVMAERKTD